MKLSFATVLLAGLAAAAPAEKQVEARQEKTLHKRLDPLTISLLGGALSGVVSAAAAQAIDSMMELFDALSDWDEAREEFTQKTVENMKAAANANEAAVCVNVGYSVSDMFKTRELASVDFESGPLKTDYDCFLMWGPDNVFTLEGDGGFINIAAQAGPCTYDQGVMTC